MKANRILGTINTDNQNIKQKLVVGSVHRSGHIEKMIDPENPITVRNQQPVKLP